MIEYPTFLVTAFANRMSKPNPKAVASITHDQATRPHREIGPIGTAVRLVVGLLLVGSIVYGQLSSSRHLTPSTWVLGLLGFPALVLSRLDLRWCELSTRAADEPLLHLGPPVVVRQP